MPDNADFLVVGGGIVGLTAARELARAGHKVVILEKEPALGMHASGRNSGVLHSGLYYPKSSLKFRYCFEGCALMKEYAGERKIPVLPLGKVIVAKNEDEAERVRALHRRAAENGVPARLLTPKELAEIEPAAATCEVALHSPSTCVTDPPAVLESLRGELAAAGVELRLGEGLLGLDARARRAKTSGGGLSYGRLVNCAGLHADRVAHMAGVGLEYRILPFKGLYRRLSGRASSLVRGLIYPAPDPEIPFLGVHLTPTAHGEVLVGPTAIPAFGRENYGFWEGIDPWELPAIARELLRLWLSGAGFRALARAEFRRYLGGGFYKEARALLPELRPEDLEPSEHAGIRAQLVDTARRALVMDFLVLDGPGSVHVLNAVSPAFTASFSFAKLVAQRAQA